MADRGAREQSLAAAMRELATIHHHGVLEWHTSGGAAEVSTIEALLGCPASQGASEAERFYGELREALATLGAGWHDAAVRYLGYPKQTAGAGDGAKPPKKPSKTACKRAAAEALNTDLRNFTREVKSGRKYSGREFKTYENALLFAAADALLARAAAALEDEPVKRVARPRVDLLSSIHGTSHAELRDLGFFQRPSTASYVRDLAELAASQSPITVFAGSGASADAVEPMRSRLMEETLARALLRTNLLEGDAAPQEREAIIERVSAAVAAAYPSSYLGSVLGEVSRRHFASRVPDPDTLRQREDGLRTDLETLIAAGENPGQFLARAIAACAFAARHCGSEVTVLTSNYDSTLTTAAEHVRIPHYLPNSLESYSFRYLRPASATGLPAGPVGRTEVMLAQISGSIASHDSPLALGEADCFRRADADAQEPSGFPDWRRQLLDHALEHTTCVFLGDTLSDPDIVARLAETRGHGLRYALLLEPQLTAATGRATTHSRARSSLERHAIRETIAQRFLHLGVVPIIADHPHHIPQLLREVGLCALQQDGYEDYDRRSSGWWGYWAKAFGYSKPTGPAAAREEDLQQHWHVHPLAIARKQITKALARKSSSGKLDEQFVLEVWVRNPHSRELILWSRSDALWLDGATVHRASLRQPSGYVAQAIFQDGQTRRFKLDPERGPWRYCWSIPLVLYQQPWYHLPIGVLNILGTLDSDEQDQQGNVTRQAHLPRIADPRRGDPAETDALEDALKNAILRELDPATSTWRHSDRPAWKGHYNLKTRRARRS